MLILWLIIFIYLVYFLWSLMIWHGNASFITGPLWGESTSYWWIPLGNVEILWFLCCWVEQAGEQTIKSPVTCDIITSLNFLTENVWPWTNSCLLAWPLGFPLDLSRDCHQRQVSYYITLEATCYMIVNVMQKIRSPWMDTHCLISLWKSPIHGCCLLLDSCFDHHCWNCIWWKKKSCYYHADTCLSI